MSGGNRGVPNNVKKMIENLKEIYLNHSDDEIYAVLKDSSMDPNVTADKLLHQDTFHEVKRKKDRKFEINREIADSRRSSPPRRGGRGGRGNHSSRYSVHVPLDAGDGRNTAAVKENGHAFDKAGSVSSLHVARDVKRKDKGSSVTEISNGPIGVLSGSTNNTDTSNVLPRSFPKHPEIPSKSRSHSSGVKRSSLMSGVKAQSVSATTFSGVSSSALDPVLVPTSVTRVPAAGAIKREVGSQRSHVEPKAYISAEHKSNAGKIGGKSQGVGKNQATEVMQSSHGSSSSSRPSSNYGNRSQPVMGSQKVGPNKEWKPKSSNATTGQVPKAPLESGGSDVLVEISSRSEVSNILIEASPHSQPVERTVYSEEGTNKLQQKLESLHVRDAQHVIIPNHIHVPDAVRTSLNFGSFDTGFVLPPKHSVEPENEDSKIVSEALQDKEDTLEDQASSGQNTLTAAEEADYTNCSSTPEGAEPLSSDDVIVPSSVLHLPVFNEGKGATSAPQSSSVNTSYCFPHFPPMLGNQLGQTEGSECQSQVGNSVVLPTPGAPLATHSTGVMPNSITQPPLPLLRQPAGIHLPHYPPNFIPYGHYFSPFYVPPPMHPFYGNNAFHQQAQTGNLYPPPPAASLAPVKFPPQYKPGNNAGNSSHMGVGGGYGPYGVPSSGFNSGPAAAAGNIAGTEEHAASQFKDNVYFTGQQTEGPAVWFPGSGRDISNLPANAFYNLPPHGQHMAYGPTQGGQGSYAGIFHPAQAVTAANVHHSLLQQSQPMPGAVDMMGATANVYQQPQHPQMNWPNSY